MGGPTSQLQKEIAALNAAVESAEKAMSGAIEALVRLEDAYPSPTHPTIENMKARLGTVIQSWTDARNYVDQQLRTI